MDRSLQLDHSYNGWVKAGQLLTVPKWLCNTKLSDLTKLMSRSKIRAAD